MPLSAILPVASGCFLVTPTTKEEAVARLRRVSAAEYTESPQMIAMDGRRLLRRRRLPMQKSINFPDARPPADRRNLR